MGSPSLGPQQAQDGAVIHEAGRLNAEQGRRLE